MIIVGKNSGTIKGEINLPVSKSCFNRLTIIYALAGEKIASESGLPDDCQVMLDALEVEKSEINIGHAGTAMRFLTAYFSVKKQEVTMSGSSRMHERPIEILTAALNELGSEIQHLEKQCCPPLRIGETKAQGGNISIDSSVSSQYISALLLVAPYMKNGLSLTLENDLVSSPYVEMTIALMKDNGVQVVKEKNGYRISPQTYKIEDSPIERDWSSASFWYELVALNAGSELLLNGLTKDSIQGDAILPDLYNQLGVSTVFTEKGALIKQDKTPTQRLGLDAEKYPDLALPIACTAVGLQIPFEISGLSTLKNKESNRVVALSLELAKMGVTITNKDDTIFYKGEKPSVTKATLQTHEDHRIAMSLAPLSTAVGHLNIENPEVVSKSYPDFWEEFSKLADR